LRFDSAEPNPRYAGRIEQCLEALDSVTVITSDERQIAKKITRDEPSVLFSSPAPTYGSGLPV
jgi:hypothetical protein